jgi:hypothetical protein
MTEHFCEECVFAIPRWGMYGRCGKPAKFKIGQVSGDEFVYEWFCAEHYDKRVEYATVKQRVE